MGRYRSAFPGVGRLQATVGHGRGRLAHRAVRGLGERFHVLGGAGLQSGLPELLFGGEKNKMALMAKT